MCASANEDQHAIQRSGPSDDLLRRLLHECMAATSAEEGGVLVRNARSGELRVEYCEGPGVFMKKRLISFDPNNSLCALAASRMEPVYVPDVGGGEAPYLPLSDSTIHSELVIPLTTEGKCIGLINLESHRQDAFSSEQRELAVSLCNSHSRALDQHLHEREAHFLRAQVAAVGDILREMCTSEPDQDKVLSLILQNSLCLAEAHTGGLLTVSPDGMHLQLRCATNIKEEHRHAVIAKGSGLVWECLQQSTMDPLNLDSEDPLFISRFMDLSSGPRIRSILVVPLVFKGRPLGVLNIESISRNAFGFEHEEMLRLFADQAALFLRLIDLRERWRGAWALANFGDLTDNLAHRMNNLIGGIRELGRFIVSSSENETVQEQSSSIVQTAQKALQVIQDYRDLFQQDRDSVDIAPQMRQIISSLPKDQARRISVSATTSEATVVAPKVQVRELLSELVANAMKQSPEGAPVEVRVSSTLVAVILEVVDQGPGFPEDRIERVFERGFRGSTSAPGSGYGLWWARQFLAAIGGQIELKNREGGGAIVRVIFPRHGSE